MKQKVTTKLRNTAHRSVLWLQVVILAIVGMLPVFMWQTASAAQLTSRSVTISTSEGDAIDVNYAFRFRIQSAIDVEGIIFQFCTTPLGTCNLPAGMDVDNGLPLTLSGQSFSQATAFSLVSSADGDCDIDGTGDTKVCVNRTESGNEATGVDKTLTVEGITNPTLVANFTTVYVRISLYDNSTFDSGGSAGSQIVHDGTVAAGITRQLTTAGRVQERLSFCVGALEDGAALPENCGVSFPTETTIDMGVIDDISVARAPVDVTPTNGSNDYYGIAMVNTNASSGVTVTYFPEPAASVLNTDTDQLRAFRVLPSDCSATASSTTDQCFVSATEVSNNTIVAGTEEFGLAVACVYQEGTTHNFDPENGGVSYDPYDGDGDMDDTGLDDCQNENDATFGFDISGNPSPLITSNSVVDDEIIKLSFGATANATTPTGTYVVVTTYIATPTF